MRVKRDLLNLDGPVALMIINTIRHRVFSVWTSSRMYMCQPVTPKEILMVGLNLDLLAHGKIVQTGDCPFAHVDIAEGCVPQRAVYCD